MKHLEEEAAFPLFIRDKKQLMLTGAGRQFAEKAKKIVEEFDDLEKSIQDVGRTSQTVRFASPNNLGNLLCPSLMVKFNKKYPNICFETPICSSRNAIRMVGSGNLELAIVNIDKELPEHIEYVPILKSNISGYVRNGHRLAGARAVTIGMLAQETLILNGKRAITTAAITKRFENESVEPNIFMHSNRTAVSIAMACQNNAVVFFMDELLRISGEDAILEESGMKSFSFEKPLVFSVGLIKKKNAGLSGANRAFYDFCKTMDPL